MGRSIFISYRYFHWISKEVVNKHKEEAFCNILLHYFLKIVHNNYNKTLNYIQIHTSKAGVALPACQRRVKTNSGELKLYVILPAWRVEFIVQ